MAESNYNGMDYYTINPNQINKSVQAPKSGGGFQYGSSGYDGISQMNFKGIDGGLYDSNGFNEAGFNKGGFNAKGLDSKGLDSKGYDAQGYDVNGKIKPGAGDWTGSFNNWAQAGGLAIKGLELIGQFQGIEEGKRMNRLREEGMRKDWAATRANAQVGIEGRLARQNALAGMSSVDATASAKANSNAELARYGIV